MPERVDQDTNPIKALVDLLEESGLRMTFSRWCISGLVGDCGCSRCRNKRGEPVTEETEREAEARSILETKAFYERTRAAIRKGGNAEGDI